MMDKFILSEGIKIRYEKFIEPKLSEKQKKLIKKLSDEIYKELTGEELSHNIKSDAK